MDSWRYQLLYRLRLANGETRTGDGHVRSLQLRLRRSKCRSGNYTLRQRPMSPRIGSAGGASETGTDVTSQKGCSKPGIFPWIQTSAATHDHPLVEPCPDLSEPLLINGCGLSLEQRWRRDVK
jgi:hypothetical protein